MLIQAKILVSGKVQGVFFRAHAREKALEFGLCGYAKNLEDGCVEIFAHGKKLDIEKLEQWCYRGSPSSKVETVVLSWAKKAEPDPDYSKGFDIL